MISKSVFEDDFAMIYVYPTYFDCIEKAAEKAAEKARDLKEKTIIFCEDKLTLSCESALAEKAGGFFGVEVLSFGRYIRKRMQGVSSLSKEGGAMAVKKILSSCESKLTVFKSLASSPSLAKSLSELIAQLKSAKVTPEMLKESLYGLSESVSAKIGDIALVFGLYEEFLKENRLTDSNNSLTVMPSLLEADEQMRNANIIFVGYSSVTKQSYDVFKTLSDFAKNCDFFCVSGDNENVYTGEFLSAAKAICGETPLIGKTSAPIDAVRLSDFLYEPTYEQKVGLYSDKVAIYEAKDVSDECDYIAARIRYEVINGGLSFKDIAVAVGSPSDYALTLKRKFKDYEIPYYLNEKRTLSFHPAVKLILSALKAFELGGDLEEIRKIISSAAFIPEKSYADAMLKIMRDSSSTTKSFLKSDSPLFLEDLYLNSKQAAIRRLFASLTSAKTAFDYCERIRTFLADAGVEENLKTLGEKLEKAGEAEDVSFNEEAFAAVDALLTETESVLGDEVLSAGDFRRIFLSGAEAAELSIIPQFYDSVYIAPLSDCRFKQYKILFAAGLNGGVPSVKEDTALLLDGDITKLDALSVKIEPKIRTVNRREQESCCVALMSFKEKLYLSFADSVGGDNSGQSEMLEYIQAAFSDEKNSLKPFDRISLETARLKSDGERKDRMDAFDFLAVRPALFSLVKDGDDFKNGSITDIDAASSFYLALKKKGDSKNLAVANSLLNEVNTELKTFCIVPPENYFSDKNVSASELETYYQCPYKNFLKYGVGLSDTQTGEMRALDFGNILHAVAQKFIEVFDTLTDENVGSIAEKLFDEEFAKPEYSRFLQRSDYEYSSKLIKKEAVAFCKKIYSEFKNSLFKPVGAEVTFADWGEYKALPLRTKQGGYKLFGKTDRIDRYDGKDGETYIRIIDYKTGNVDKKLKSESLYVGVNLQLYLYMNAFSTRGEKPAGAYYYAVNDNFVKTDESPVPMRGKTVLNEEILEATDRNIVQGLPSDTVKVAKASKKNSGYDGELSAAGDFTAYMRYAKKMAEKGVDDILSGVIISSPYDNACEYCEYGALCRHDRSSDNRTRKANGVNEKTITEAIGAEDERRS